MDTIFPDDIFKWIFLNEYIYIYIDENCRQTILFSIVPTESVVTIKMENTSVTPFTNMV